MCTDISNEPAANIIRVDDADDTANMFLRASETLTPPTAISTVTVHKDRLLAVFRSAACHVSVLHIIFVRDIFFFTASKPTVGAHTASYSIGIEGSFAGIKPDEREAGHSAASRAKVKHSYSCTCIAACAFIASTGTTVPLLPQSYCELTFLAFFGCCGAATQRGSCPPHS